MLNLEFGIWQDFFSFTRASRICQSDEDCQKGVLGQRSYIPRIFFLDPQGQVLDQVYNSKGNPSYKYFYFNVDTVLSSMRQVLEDFSEAKQEL